MVLQPHQMAVFNRNNTLKNIKKDSILASISNTENLTDIKGIGEGTRKQLSEKGIKTKEQLIEMSIEEIKEIIKNPLSLKGVMNFINTNKEQLWVSEQSKTTD